MSEPAGAAREINDALAAGLAQTRRPRPQSGLPAAFIKACKLIYDIIMFFVDNAERILKFVNTVIDSAVDIVRGNVGGIGEKIRAIIATLQKPINKAIDFVIKSGLKLAGPIIRGLKGIGSKVKAKVAAGKKWVKGKVTAVGEALGIVAKPFSVGRDQHTLDVDTRTGSIAMASRQRREVSRTIAQEVADVNERRKATVSCPLVNSKNEQHCGVG